MEWMESDHSKARLTAKGNVKVTLTQRQARLIVALLGQTTGVLGYTVYKPLRTLVGEMDTFDDAMFEASINTDEVE
jgi:hypothetical protein